MRLIEKHAQNGKDSHGIANALYLVMKADSFGYISELTCGEAWADLASHSNDVYVKVTKNGNGLDTIHPVRL